MRTFKGRNQVRDFGNLDEAEVADVGRKGYEQWKQPQEKERRKRGERMETRVLDVRCVESMRKGREETMRLEVKQLQ